ncbi:hypothetical protein HZA99_04650 [Candidatus Woesearchaeota archaeon]|nr:hypothetical protein [Candidatus Woesearchaeota archaeon]
MAEEKENKKPLVKKKAPLTKKKKSWFQIVAPDVFGKAALGETLVEDSKHLLGKTIELSLMSLTGDMKKQNMNVKFAVDQIMEGRGICRVVSYEIAPSSIKRMVRRGRMRVDASIVVQTKDGIKVRVKPFLLTAYETKRSLVAAVRRQVIAFVATYFANSTYDQVFKDVVSGRLQMGVREACKGIYPIRNSEIRMMTVVKDTVAVSALPSTTMNVEKIMESAQNARQQRYSAPRRPYPQQAEAAPQQQEAPAEAQ